MADRSIIIIGAGIAGLAAGCYGQMNGYHTQIFELHDKPGGLCTSWKRKGYTFDGCIHWLVGSGPGSAMNRLWQELGAVQGRPFVDHDEFLRIEGKSGKTFIVYTNVDRLEQHMQELSPADAGVAHELAEAVRIFTRMNMPLDMPSGLANRIKAGAGMLPYLSPMRKWSKITVQEFAARFRDPFLCEAFSQFFDLPDFPMVAVLMTLAWMHKHDAGYPIGGSLEFSQAVERRYLDLGGEIHYKSRVQKILVDASRDRVVGVRLEDGAEHRADAVISAADGHATIFDMLEGRYADDTIRGYYRDLPIFQPMIQVSLGVARDLSDLPHMVSFPLDKPVTIAGQMRERMNVKHFCYDPTLSPKGKSAVVVMFDSNHAYWKQLSEDRERYDAEKQQVAITVMEQLDKRLPGFIGQVEVVDVATPLTTERYTGNWQGSIEGWMINRKTLGMMFGNGMKKTLPGLANFYMAGQWVEPGGGVPTAAMSGRTIIQTICKQDKKPFVTVLP